MAERKPVAEPMVAGDDATTPWRAALERLEKADKERTYWLATVRPDGAPHVMPILGLWLDGAFYFMTGEATRKGRDLANDGRCVLTVGTTTLPSLDLIVEGTAVKLTDLADLRKVARAYSSTLHWPIEVSDDGVTGQSAPTAGPPPFALYVLKPIVVFGLPGIVGMGAQKPTKPFAPTKWRFKAGTDRRAP